MCVAGLVDVPSWHPAAFYLYQGRDIAAAIVIDINDTLRFHRNQS